MNKKSIAVLVAVALLIGCALGGTLAWLTSNTNPVVNEFTTSDIGVELWETKEDFKMIPGYTIDKDPKVQVTTGSEACWLFVKVEESGVYKGNELAYGFDNFITYEIADGWTALENVDGVYYRKIANATTSENQETYPILKDNKVSVKGTVTKEMMQAVKDNDSYPTLTFTAYASQLYKNNNATNNEFTAAEAWANVNPNGSTGN